MARQYVQWLTGRSLSKDRGALGNARIMGFQSDLHLSGSQFYNCLMMFCRCTPAQGAFSPSWTDH